MNIIFEYDFDAFGGYIWKGSKVFDVPLGFQMFLVGGESMGSLGWSGSLCILCQGADPEAGPGSCS